MAKYTSVLHQLLRHVPRDEFRAIVERHQGVLAIFGKRIFWTFADRPLLTPTSSLAWDRRKWIGPAAEPTADRASAEGR